MIRWESRCTQSRIGFPAKKFHATPWNKQVNEGVVEWPPSPWRLLRAFIFTWYHKARSNIEEALVKRIIEKLCEPPVYLLPPVSFGHTRHFMPLFDGTPVKIFDTFVNVSKDERLYVQWDNLRLTDEESKALAILLNRIGYLGRAESWVEMKPIARLPGLPNSRPFIEGDDLPPSSESVALLCCQSPEEYESWKLRFSQETSTSMKRGRPRARTYLPEDLFHTLLADTGELKVQGWSQPPGSKWIEYLRPSNIFEVTPVGMGGYKNDLDNPTVARFAVASQVPPRLTDAVSLAERIHKALVSRSKSPVFTGCDDNGKRLSGHRHAFILCESNLTFGRGKRGEITHITLYAPDGFGADERKALDSLVKIWGHGGHDVQLILIGLGKPDDFSGSEERGLCPLLDRSQTWISRTPFIPTRHPKATRTGIPKKDESGLQKGSPEHDLRRLLRENGFPDPIKIEPVLSTNLAGHHTRWLAFRRARKHGDGVKAGENGFGFKVEFAEAVGGPIALGYGCHFGLGLFVPAKELSDDHPGI